MIVGRPAKKEQLIQRCEELNIFYSEKMTIKELEALIADKERDLVAPVVITEDMMTPYEYFQNVKDSIKSMNDDDLTKMYTAASTLMEKYQVFGQEKAEKRLAFHIKTILKEHDLLQLGINKFVYKDDITNYIDVISKKPVKIIEMKNFPREIPDDMIDVVTKTKGIFDEYYVLFTDYSEGELVKEVEKERDPILFGGFCTKNRDIVSDRFYYLGDWVDEYCDLTLDKLIKETSKDIVKTISIPTNKDKLISQLNAYEEKGDRYIVNTPKKEHFFSKIKRAFKVK